MAGMVSTSSMAMKIFLICILYDFILALFYIYNSTLNTEHSTLNPFIIQHSSFSYRVWNLELFLHLDGSLVELDLVEQEAMGIDDGERIGVDDVEEVLFV